MLPDEATLNRLAGAFFSALPSASAGLPAAPMGPSVLQPDMPTSPPNVPVPSPVPTATAVGAPGFSGAPHPGGHPPVTASSGAQEVSGATSGGRTAAPYVPGVTGVTAPTSTPSAASGTTSPGGRTPSAASGTTESATPPSAASGTRASSGATPPGGRTPEPSVPGVYGTTVPGRRTPTGVQGLSGTTPPGGSTPDPSVPSWGRDVPMADAAGQPAHPPVSTAGIHHDPFLTALPSLREVLSPQRFPEPAAPSSAAPSFYFLDAPTSTGTIAPARLPDAHPPFDVYAVRNDFPILREQVNGHPLVWFDNAATTQKPRSVIERITRFYEHENSNIHRAAHELAARSTDAYEQARDIVARFIGASSAEEIIFVRGATEGINLIAQTWGRKNIRAGDEIIISHLEHHANIVPWQLLAAETGAQLKVIPVDDNGELLLGEYTRLLSDRTKLVSVTHVSNALGTITPVREIVAEAQRAGAVTLVDGAQSVPHTSIDVRSIGADFFVFSGHKLFGPTGIGVVYGKSEILQDVPPWQGGGNMISDVTLERSLFQPPPGRFEAGTGNIADAVGLGAAIEYVERLGMDAIARYEHHLLEYATPRVAAVRGVRLVGTAADKASVLSFVMDGYEPIEVGRALNEQGIAVRAGHHCAQPILRRLGLEATVRPSFAFYNTCAEIDRMVAALDQLAARSPR
ncbi:family 2A encapsulin nanocompartment cargo protein cysteine desulfurase [Nocardia sp. CS682]|uniref:family 2A encapsulin nanocompartment cargo protein cysteine desulfurase n=1 Tax=Nocardia sp. CS682 TaxID=1047172 RepID=UPI001430ED5C|nr:family 2A encapsulin nanocompartment cargo protein cysteine desulfurase [Nocardia sp. CS682]